MAKVDHRSAAARRQSSDQGLCTGSGTRRGTMGSPSPCAIHVVGAMAGRDGYDMPMLGAGLCRRCRPTANGCDRADVYRPAPRGFAAPTLSQTANGCDRADVYRPATRGFAADDVGQAPGGFAAPTFTSAG
jgi:hypothetical protein